MLDLPISRWVLSFGWLRLAWYIIRLRYAWAISHPDEISSGAKSSGWQMGFKFPHVIGITHGSIISHPDGILHCPQVRTRYHQESSHPEAISYHLETSAWHTALPVIYPDEISSGTKSHRSSGWLNMSSIWHTDEISLWTKSSGRSTQNFVMSSGWFRVESYVIRMIYEVNVRHREWARNSCYCIEVLPRVVSNNFI